LGALFRHKDKERDEERELLVFITPHIIKDEPMALAAQTAYPEKGAALDREQQSPASYTERGKSISSVLDNFEE
jgi:Flp pilus assembly secretin CpaC